jgi:RPA family protein
MTGREPAWRVLAQEFGASIEEEKGVGERAASYLISPLGARMNRVLVSGILSPGEAVGRDPENPFYRANLTDPTGTISVTAGGFQPRALESLRTVTTPTPAVVVGKVHLFRGRDGTAYASVRAEAIHAASTEEVRSHLADAVQQTADRIRLMETISGELAGSDAAVPGFPALWVRSAREARHRYPNADRGRYRTPLRETLRTVSGEVALAPPAAPAALVTPPRVDATAASPAVRITHTPPPPPPALATAAERAEESAFLDVIDQLADKSADGYADLNEVVRAAARTGVTSQRAEELLGKLEESGAVEEPVVGKLRRS